MNVPSCLLFAYQATGYHWVYILIIVLIAVAAGVAAAFTLKKKLSKQQAALSSPPASSGKAKLVLPGSTEIPLATGAISIGRQLLARIVPVENLVYISHQHFAVSLENGEYTIADLDSLNGTKLNGMEIKGEGKKTLKDGDPITIADVATIIFKAD